MTTEKVLRTVNQKAIRNAISILVPVVVNGEISRVHQIKLEKIMDDLEELV